MVLKIFELNDPTRTIDSIESMSHNICTKYAINNIVMPDKFDEVLYKVCTSGIHYFKTIETAYYYRNMPKNYKDVWLVWNDHGKLDPINLRLGLSNNDQFDYLIYENENEFEILEILSNDYFDICIKKICDKNI